MTLRADDGQLDLVRRYLNEIGSVPLLTAAQEVELGKRIEAGLYAEQVLGEPAGGPHQLTAVRRHELRAVAEDGRQARDHMIKANLRLVVAVARKHYRQGVPLLDAIQNGTLGLIHAVEKFDYTKGYKFSTYATWWIRQAIDRGAAEGARTIRLPMHVWEELNKVRAAEHQLALHQAQEPTAEELAGRTGQTAGRVADLRRIGRAVVSLDTPVGEDAALTLGELVEDTELPSTPDIAEHHALIDDVAAAVAALPPREAQVITLRFGLRTGKPSTLRETAERLRISPERVRQLQLHALDRLRDPDHRPCLSAWAG
ncbi:sigma-70 family RNA polymerase sigma factor [Actinophytocola sp.]|uniref:sigma-70 family RNA polymerase sigma factor n=1 Tax=Actinophytocola sp. TaxID=1872138 RepID=UPI002D7EFAD7|nr:sigma-70 family RNA polymerase sigma factor [Actinophytocola sp.]HET9139810.1 sigma-70 family RNA polymerase sigma factor [Actinophytocola sp.]